MPEIKIFKEVNTPWGYKKECHMAGDYVGVVWIIREERTELAGGGYKVVPVKGTPHIEFISIFPEGGVYFQDENNPAAGELSIKEAEQISQELIEAIRYFKTL